jgi:predicted deacylase
MERESATHRTAEYQLGRLPSGTDVSVPVHRYVGGAGPTVYVQAGQHGIELNGPAAARRLHDRLVSAELAGTVILVPLANPLAFDNRSYLTPAAYDAVNSNQNRGWPGDETGTLQERLVARLWDLAAGTDAVVDLHTGTADMLEHVRFDGTDPAARALATAFGTEYLLADPTEPPADEEQGKFRTVAAREGIPALTAELSNSRTVARPAVETGVEGVLNVLRELDVLAGAPAESPAETVLEDDVADTVATEPGLFEPAPDIEVGDALQAGAELGTVYCPSSFEQRETVTVEASGVAYSLTREAAVYAGERLAGVAASVPS